MADWFVFCLLATGIQIDGCRNEVAKKMPNCIIRNPHSELSFFRLVLIYNLRVQFLHMIGVSVLACSPPKRAIHLAKHKKNSVEHDVLP